MPKRPKSPYSKGMTVDEKIELLRMELKVIGFAVVKEIASLTKQTSGTMKCPLCQQDLRFSVAPNNGHLRAKCSTKNCISAME